MCRGFDSLPDHTRKAPGPHCGGSGPFAFLAAVADGQRWTGTDPDDPRLLSGLALLGGGVFFVYYRGLAFLFDMGRWGFKLGWYGT